MATPKVTKQANTPATPPAQAPSDQDKKDKMAAARAARDSAAQDDVFTYKGEVKEGTKRLAPQAQNIVNLIQAAGKKGIKRKDLVEGMKGVVTTRQPMGRILTYYQKTIVDLGHVTMTKASAPAEPAPAAAK